MDEALKVKLIGYLDAIEGAVESGSAFVASEMPLVAWELVAYHRAVSTVYVLISLVVSVLASFAAVKVWRWAEARKDGDQPATLFPLLIAVGAFGFAVDSSSYLLKAWFAPRLLILEELAKLL